MVVAIFQATSLPLAVIDELGRILATNRAFCSVMERPASELLGLDEGGLSLPKGHFSRRQPLVSGHILLELYNDIGQQLHDVQRSNAQMRAIFENTFEFIGLLNPEGLLLEANSVALAFIGRDSLGALFGVHFADTPWWEHDAAGRALLIDAIDRAGKGEFVRFETTHTGPDGLIHVDFSLKPVHDALGNLVFLVPEGRDITLGKQAEADVLNAKKEAEKANLDKSEILTNMSHELRTPLNAVIGYSEALQTGMFGQPPTPKFAEYINDIHDAGLHLLAVINDILDVSAIDAGKIDLHDESVNVAEVVEASIRLIAPKAEKGEVTVVDEVLAKLPHLRADERRLKQIVLNLLSNAVKFTPKSGTVRVSTRITREGRMEIVVVDTGIGMDQDGIAKALSLFGQVDSGLSRSQEGSGLGLPLTKNLIELHGGILTIDSERALAQPSP